MSSFYFPVELSWARLLGTRSRFPLRLSALVSCAERGASAGKAKAAMIDISTSETKVGVIAAGSTIEEGGEEEDDDDEEDAEEEEEEEEEDSPMPSELDPTLLLDPALVLDPVLVLDTVLVLDFFASLASP